MPKNSVLGSPSHVAKLPKQGFNLSHSLKFTSATGQLLPVLHDQLRVGEKVRLNCNLFTRTQPLATAAMVDIMEFVDFFFVPMRKLYHNFDQLITSVDDFHSTLFDSQVNRTSDIIMPFVNSLELSRAARIGIGHDDWGSYSTRFDRFTAGSVRLLDLLELLPNSLLSYTENPGQPPQFTVPETYLPAYNPAALLAYQAIYYDYYRLSNWEANYVKAYNVDDVSNGLAVPVLDSQNMERVMKMYELHYRPYQRDYFKALEPSPLLSPISTLGLRDGVSISNIRQWLGFSTDVINNKTFDDSDNPKFGDSLTQVAVHSDYDDLSLSSLRSAYAFEKLLKITNRAGKHYDDQVLAHFGFKIPRGISEEVYYLGGINSKLTIGEVVATADTSDNNVSNLAEIAGKGYNIKGQGNGVMSDIDFVAPCDGILMAVYSCVPKPSYVVALNRLHTRLTKYDYPQPELDNLGMQPMFGYQGVPFDGKQNLRIGWQYRYMESKVKYNRATHQFIGRDGYGQDLNAWGMMHDWTIALLPYQTDYNFDVANWFDYLLCRPTDLNDIMVVNYNHNIPRGQLVGDGTGDVVWYDQLYAFDPLIHDLSFKYYKTSFMSTFGIDDVDI